MQLVNNAIGHYAIRQALLYIFSGVEVALRCGGMVWRDLADVAISRGCQVLKLSRCDNRHINLSHDMGVCVEITSLMKVC